MVVLPPAGLVHDDLHQLGQGDVVDGDEGGGHGGLALGQDVDDERHEADDPRADQQSPDELDQPPVGGGSVRVTVTVSDRVSVRTRERGGVSGVV